MALTVSAFLSQWHWFSSSLQGVGQYCGPVSHWSNLWSFEQRLQTVLQVLTVALVVVDKGTCKLTYHWWVVLGGGVRLRSLSIPQLGYSASIFHVVSATDYFAKLVVLAKIMLQVGCCYYFAAHATLLHHGSIIGLYYYSTIMFAERKKKRKGTWSLNAMCGLHKFFIACFTWFKPHFYFTDCVLWNSKRCLNASGRGNIPTFSKSVILRNGLTIRGYCLT